MNVAHLSIVGTSLLFALAGAMTRFRLRTTLTRLQLVGFLLIALAAEHVLGHLIPTRQTEVGFVADSATASVAIVLMKWRIEGLPRWTGRRRGPK